VIKEIADALIFILPAYAANGAPVIVAKIAGKKHPIDFGKNFLDNRRILGEGKTLEGFIGGVAIGTGVAFLLQIAGFHNTEKGLVLSVGALLGDMAGSFLKRRLGLKRGEPAPLIDQLDFLTGSLVLYWILYGPVDANMLIILFLLTPVLHVLTNAMAYLLGLKNEPW